VRGEAVKEAAKQSKRGARKLAPRLILPMP